MKKQKIIVVEGKSDTNLLKSINPNIITFETSGLGLTDEKLDELKKLSKDYEIVIFTDPDGPGERIRKKINENISNCQNIFIPSRLAKDEKLNKVGVEHAKKEIVLQALANVQIIKDQKEKYSIKDLMDWNIYASKQKRLVFCEKINISYGNNQKIIKQLNNFGIEIEKIQKVLAEMEQDGII